MFIYKDYKGLKCSSIKKYFMLSEDIFILLTLITIFSLLNKQLKMYFFCVHSRCSLCNQNQLANVSVCESALFGKKEASGNIPQFHKCEWMKVKIENTFC